jgi:hypothetical protein
VRLLTLVSQLSTHVCLQVCDTVAELAATTLASGGSGWPELLPFLSQAVQSGQPRLMEASLLIFAQLAGHMMDTLIQFLGTLLQVQPNTPIAELVTLGSR